MESKESSLQAKVKVLEDECKNKDQELQTAYSQHDGLSSELEEVK